MTLTTLAGILEETRRRVADLRPKAHQLERAAANAPPGPDFESALRAGGSTVGIIAEVKRRSPSAGAIRADLEPAGYARACVRGGAVAISVLTDVAHFGGSVEDLRRVARAVPVPALRKDFIVDVLQLLEARASGASGVLLIVRALPPDRLGALAREARGLGLATLIEVHSEVELDLAVSAEPTAIGVNSRDLDTFAVDLGTAARLLARVPASVPAVAESGVEGRPDVERLAEWGADLALVGTSVARSADPEKAVQALCGVPRRGR